jgi:uncharacterized protein (DUF488 family)
VAVVRLFTIGHSAHALEKFVNLLELHGIQTVVDVRSVPASRFHPQFSKRNLAQSLACQEIQYVFLGRELGGRPSDPTCYAGGVLPKKGTKPWPTPDYTQVVKRDWFARGIEHLLRYAAERPTVVLCSEEDPTRCHRHFLIAEYLGRHHPNIEVLHIRDNGALLRADEVQRGRTADRQLALL